MQLIGHAHFQGIRNIPQVTNIDSGVGESVDLAISGYQSRYLNAVLGPSMCVAFLAGLAGGDRSYFSARFSSRFRRTPLDPRWSWLVDGHTFMIHGAPTIWPGFKSQASPIADYIFWYWKSENITGTESTGEESQATSENTKSADSRDRMRSVWNRMVALNRQLNIILLHSGLYPEFRPAELWQDPESLNVYNKQTWL